MLTYYNGWKGNVDFIAEYDDEANFVNDNNGFQIYSMYITSMGNPNVAEYRFNTIKEAQDKGYYFAREISESEYNVLLILKWIYTEVRMHDITGGFPRPNVIEDLMKSLHDDITTWINEIN